MRIFTTLLLLAFASLANAGEDHKHPMPVLTPEFEKLKTLVGTWEGKNTMNGKEETVKVTYELTSGGTAIVEKIGPGTPMEMVTMYANNGKTVNATHYCAMGNQPQMKLKSSKENTFAFEMVGTNGISNKKEAHMHGVTLTIEGNKLKQEWTNFKDGKKEGVHTFELTKKI